ncbi:MAG: TetR/AcrR family transcriptional regulator [Candidatus Geothermincolales bacterium]
MPRRSRREDILKAGKKVFAEKGFQKTTVEDILRESGVARATFYSYFDSKKDLYVELLQGILDQLYRIASESLEGQPTTLREFHAKTAETFERLYRFFLDNMDFAAIYLREVMRVNPEIDFMVIRWQEKLADFVKGILEKGIEKGLFKPMDMDIAATVISGVPQHIALIYFFYKNDMDVKKIARNVATFLIYGMTDRKRPPDL